MLHDTFRTIAHSSEGLYKEKGSKFISFAFPVNSEDEIKVILASIRKDHFSARHCCFAWSLGVEQVKYRMNDDGEPSGTAGRPIYGQIQSHCITNVLLVVVRYFGGTLLGVSGLIQAYKHSANDAILNAGIVCQTVEYTLEVLFDHLAMNRMMRLVKDEQLEIVKTHFDLDCVIHLKVRSTRVAEIEAKIVNTEGVLACRIV
jgi:uncharacterized YigZ family protein